MKKQITSCQNLGFFYRQYVQFLNDLIIISPLTQVLILLPNVTMIIVLILNLDDKFNVIDQLSILGIAQLLYKLVILSQIMQILIPVLLLTVIILPFIVLTYNIIEVIISSQQKYQIGKFKRIFQHSLTHKFIRVELSIFQYTLLPIITHIASKNLHSQNSFLSNISLVFLILVPIIYLIGQYHCLQINFQDPFNKIGILMRINFPNNIIDNVLIFAFMILVEQFNGITPFIVAIIIYSIRIFIIVFFPCYDVIIQDDQLNIVVNCFIFTIGILLAYITKQILIIILFISMLMIFIQKIISKINSAINEQETNYIKVQQHEEMSIDQLKKKLWEDGLFTYTYRQLIFLQRKNNGYRTQLIIDILKQKCYLLQLQARGGAKIVNSNDLMRFQAYYIDFLRNLLIIADKSISVLKLLEQKNPKCFIFTEQIDKLVAIINANKQIITKMFQLNQFSMEARQLLELLYRHLYGDSLFIKSMEQKIREQVNTYAERTAKLKLFKNTTSVLFINILDQVGKITKASKNLPAVLGYTPHHLIGLSINQIIPFTIKPFHDQILTRFVNQYSKRTRKRDPKIVFYAYDKDFHLEHICVTYYFIMSNFSKFQLSGVFRKINSEEDVILTDYYGNIQGWTKNIGGKIGLDQYRTSQCKAYNILPLIPALTKYFISEQQIKIQTIIFKPCQLSNATLIIASVYTEDAEIKLEQIWGKVLPALKKLSQDSEIVEAYLAKISISTVKFCQGKAKMRKIMIHQYQIIQNLEQTELNLTQYFKTYNQQEQIQERNKSMMIVSNNPSEHNVSMSISNVSSSDVQQNRDNIDCKGQNSAEQQIQKTLFDTNFSPQANKRNAICRFMIKTSRQNEKNILNTIDIDFQNGEIDEEKIQEDQTKNIQQNNKHQNNFQPMLQRTSNFLCLLILLTILMMFLLIYDTILTIQTKSTVKQQSQQVINRNRQMMIFVKSVFNPNITYVQQFQKGQLIGGTDLTTLLPFKTYLGDILQVTYFYLFNIQIPSTLERIAISTGALQNQYYKEISQNFNTILNAYDSRLNQNYNNWKIKITQFRQLSILKICFIGVGSLVYSIFLIFLYLQDQKQKKTIEAFFKFERSDIQDKILQIKKVIEMTENKVAEWHLEKQFYQIAKSEQITNVQFKNYNNNYEQKIKFQVTEDKQQQINKKKFYSVLIYIIVFLATQLIFLIVYVIMSMNIIGKYQAIPNTVNLASKLIIWPNLQIANLFLEVPNNILIDYEAQTKNILENSTPVLPKLSPLLEQAPCFNCTYLYPLLTTNFRSYYSNFKQIIIQKQATGNRNIDQLYKSVDVVVQRIMSALSIGQLQTIWPIVFLYIFSLIIFFFSFYFGIRKMNQQSEKLQVLLKYFKQQVLTKNKLMNGVLNKNI